MAGSTDDVECFFGLLHHLTKGQNVTLKEFKYSRSFMMTSGGQEKLKESMKKCTTSTSCSPKALIDMSGQTKRKQMRSTGPVFSLSCRLTKSPSTAIYYVVKLQMIVKMTDIILIAIRP